VSLHIFFGNGDEGIACHNKRAVVEPPTCNEVVRRHEKTSTGKMTVL
jgi:hypothetical protein